MPQGMIWEVLFGSFGVAAAFLLVGGWVMLRYQRDRQQFQLTQAALEKGFTAMPGLIPGWVLSLRQGVLALVLGAGLCAAGALLAVEAQTINQPPVEAAASRPAATSQEAQPRRLPPPDQMGGQQMGGQRDGPPGSPGGPPGRPNGPPGMPSGPRMGGDRSADGPPHLNPAMERWHRVESQKLAGIVTMSAGAILALLGLVRIVFARMERKYAAELAKG